jgi:hypothetical protein
MRSLLCFVKRADRRSLSLSVSMAKEEFSIRISRTAPSGVFPNSFNERIVYPYTPISMKRGDFSDTP